MTAQATAATQADTSTKLAFTIPEAGRYVGISRAGMYNALAAGGPRTFYVGKSRRISKQALLDWIAEREAAAGDAQ